MTVCLACDLDHFVRRWTHNKQSEHLTYKPSYNISVKKNEIEAETNDNIQVQSNPNILTAFSRPFRISGWHSITPNLLLVFLLKIKTHACNETNCEREGGREICNISYCVTIVTVLRLWLNAGRKSGGTSPIRLTGRCIYAVSINNWTNRAPTYIEWKLLIPNQRE